MTERPARPRWTGIDTYVDPHGRFHYRVPLDWHRFELDNGLEGVMFSPQAENPQTYFSSWARKLDEHIVAEDLPVLRTGVAEGLRQLPECRIESEDEGTYGNLLKFERIFTFRDGDAVRKRKIWILYVDYWQIVLTYQGESPEEWEYWLPMGNYAFMHFTIPQELWFATDRDLTKVSVPQATERVPRGRKA
jgi:hypothetical protein